MGRMGSGSGNRLGGMALGRKVGLRDALGWDSLVARLPLKDRRKLECVFVFVSGFGKLWGLTLCSHLVFLRVLTVPTRSPFPC